MSDAAGADLLRAEIREQPAVLTRLADAHEEIAALGRRLAKAPPRLVRLAAHGTSDNAATYAVYALRLLPGWSAVRDSISLPVYYGTHSDVAGDVAVALSQSGETPDVVAWLQRMSAAGALTVAVTNDPGSALAREAEVVLALGAGEERSVAATKTYSAELAVIALLAAHAAGEGEAMADALEATARSGADALPALERAVIAPATALAFTGRMVVVGRGVEYATAREVALKLTEVCQIGAVAMTATDLAHGPLAALDPLFPVWAVAADDAVFPTVAEAAARVRAAGAGLIATGPAAAKIEDATYVLEVPEPAHPLLSPLLSVLPGQLFAWALAQAKGLDPGAPRNLRKVTAAL